MIEFTGEFGLIGSNLRVPQVLRIFFGTAGPKHAPDNGRATGSDPSSNRLEPQQTEIVLSEDYNNGIRYGLHRLSQLIDHFTVINGCELYASFSRYIHTMKDVGGESWSPAYWDGIYETVIKVKTYEESQMRPKSILREIETSYSYVTKESIHNTLNERQRIRRRQIIGMLATNFHPDALIVRALGSEELKWRTEIFQTKISPAMVNDTLLGLVKLEKIARDYGIAIE